MTQAPHTNHLELADLVSARRIWRRFDAVISIEDPGQNKGLRPTALDPSRHLVLPITDLTEALPGKPLPTAGDVEQILEFARSVEGPLLLHCNHGLSRSPAAAIAVLADRLGAGHEDEALEAVLKMRPEALPNRHIVTLADAVLGRNGELIRPVMTWRDARLSALGVSLSLDRKEESIRMTGIFLSANSIGARVSRTIPAPMREVFPFVANAANDPLWINAIAHSRCLGPEPVGLGTRFEQRAVGAGGRADVVWEITEYVEDRRVTGSSISGAYRFVGGHEFEARSGATLVTKFARFERTGLLLAVPRFLGNSMMKKHFETWLETLAHRAWHIPAEAIDE